MSAQPLSDEQKAAIAEIAPVLADEFVNDGFVDDLREAAKTLRGGLNVGAASMVGGGLGAAQVHRANRLDYMADKIEATR